ncbi:DctP family TRAP transporter solute-binding subunit [Actinomadura sp. WMMB 499]|uniref:DctP family TRAP transporter solute-binding subunit n=1 Tax=Actinomadura sp. WMMB 499 TaxID=1219491 RepID=UPI001243F222|nr:DctP family TRAP transporter solute-binding subunit [Actinomadura sp. WMMB 499]QFG20838.1 DctP family TRAP transporter solute-binding subunit [Actinomadura sp. WMMB 499]
MTRRPGKTLAVLTAAAVLATGCSAMNSGDDGGTVTLSFANSYTTEHPHTRCGIQVVADAVNGQDIGVKIETFPNSQLGNDSTRFDSVKAGDVDMDVQGSSALAGSHAPVGVLDMAYAFDGPDHLFTFFDGEQGTRLKEEFAKATGTRVLDVWFFGMRHFSANSAIRTPDDLQGLRMRFPDSEIYLQNARAVGAEPTTVAFEELYLSLQRKIIDGQENPIPTIAEKSLEEVQSHVNLTGHQTGSQLVVINDDRWQELSSEQRQALQKAVSDARAGNRKCIEDDEAKILAQWRSEGEPTIVEDVDRTAFAAKAEKYFTENLEGETAELYRTIRASAP